MGRLSKKQVEYVKKNYNGNNVLELSRRLNVPVREVDRITSNLKSSKKVLEKKYCPLHLDHIYKFTKTDYLIFLGLFLVSLFTYVYTMTPGIAAGDCGELTCAVYFLGGAHSPGYPLYCVVGKLFMGLFFFIGRIVFRLTFLSAFGGAITVAVSYLFLIKFLGRYHHASKGENLIFAKIPAVTASLLFLFTEELWAQAVIAEVYTVNSLFLPIMFLIALVFEERVSQNLNLIIPMNRYDKHYVWNRVIKSMFLFFFLFGLAMGDHHIIAGYFIPFAFFFVYPYIRDKAFIKFASASTVAYGFLLISSVYYQLPDTFHFLAKAIVFIMALYIIYKLVIENKGFMIGFLIAGGFLILGFLIYVYMPIRSTANAPLDWGDPEKLENLINVITRKQYRGFAQNTRSLSVFFEQAFIIIKWRVIQFTIIPFLFTFLGLYRLFKINKKWFFFTTSFFLYYDIAFMQFNNFRFTARDLYFAKVFFIPSYMVNIFWIAIGLGFSVKLIEKYILKGSILNNKRAAWVTGITMILLSLLPFKANFNENNVRHAWANDNYGRNLLKTLEPNSVLFTEGGDNQVFSLLYHTYVEHLRPDVNVFDQKGNVFLLYGDMMRMTPQQLQESQITKDYEKISTGRPIYYTWKDFSRQNEINKRYGENFEYRQHGILYRVHTRGVSWTDPIQYWLYYDFAWKEYPEEALYWDYLSREIIANYNFQLGDFYMAKAYQSYNDYQRNKMDPDKSKNYFDQYKKYDELAYDNYREAQKFGFDMTAIHFNLSLLLEQKIQFLQQEKKFKEIDAILDEAIDNYIKAAVIENKQGNASRAYYTAGRAYEKKAFFQPEKEVEFIQEAKKYYQMALEISPSFRDAQMGVNRATAIINYPTTKLQQLEKNLNKNPKNEQLYFELVKAYIDRLEANRAVPLLERALTQIPNSGNIMFNLANLYQQLKRHEDAIRIFKRMLKGNPGQPAIYFYLAENYYIINKYAEAYQHYKIFMKVAQSIKDQNIQQMMLSAQQKVRMLAPSYEK
ncbi:MAG: DUF2723 domain-containing protein [Spirochaetes bacterium]|nr:DUF2723 domain-containing protein [Spirochaetota bacterium]